MEVVRATQCDQWWDGQKHTQFSEKLLVSSLIVMEIWYIKASSNSYTVDPIFDQFLFLYEDHARLFSWFRCDFGVRSHNVYIVCK